MIESDAERRRLWPRRRNWTIFVVCAGIAIVIACGLSGRASADPICGAPGLPACAPPAPFTLTPEQTCAVIAWRTWVPCNWWGQQVPQGTPGSVG